MIAESGCVGNRTLAVSVASKRQMVDHDEPSRGIRAQSGDLAHSSSQFQVLVDGVREYAIYMIDVNGHVMSWNTGAARIKRLHQRRNFRPTLLDLLHRSGSPKRHPHAGLAAGSAGRKI
jgi:hypothetical protein